jgi:hypothetical protein
VSAELTRFGMLVNQLHQAAADAVVLGCPDLSRSLRVMADRVDLEVSRLRKHEADKAEQFRTAVESWPFIRPSDWTDEQRAHVHKLIHGDGA